MRPELGDFPGETRILQENMPDGGGGHLSTFAEPTLCPADVATSKGNI